MNKIIKNIDSKNDISKIKDNLKIGDILFLICKEDFIATISSKGEEYVDFNYQIKNNYFRDCFLNANSTILFVSKTDVLLDATSLTSQIANIWYSVLSDYLPLERFRFKIRNLENFCVADFVSDTSGEGNFTIGYINLGKEFNQPEYENLTKNRDLKDCCKLDESTFAEIFDKVFEYIELLLKEE